MFCFRNPINYIHNFNKKCKIKVLTEKKIKKILKIYFSNKKNISKN